MSAGLRKEFAQARHDLAGLLVAVLVPAVVVWAYSGLLLDTTDLSRSRDARHPLALVLCMSVWLASLSAASTAIFQERVAGTLQRLRTTPFSPLAGVAAKAAVLAALAGVQSLVVWGAAAILMPEELAGASAVQGIMVLASLGIAAACVGLLVSAVFTSATQIANAVTLLTLASITFSGFLKPVDGMGRLGGMASGLPFTLGYDGIRETFGQQSAWAEVVLVLVESSAVLLGAALLTGWASRRTLPR